MGHTVGILLDGDTYLGVPRNKTGNERIDYYNKAAEQLGLMPFYMSLSHMSKGTALGYTYKNKQFKLERRSIPKVTHNRAITLSRSSKKKLKQLSQSSIVFNRLNRYDKHRIHKLIHAKSSMQIYLPNSMKYSPEQLMNALKKHKALFIKPTNSSVGDGIVKISKQSDGKWCLYWKKGNPKLVSSKQVLSLIDKIVGHKKYMIQEAISLATYHGRPYDLRVSVQRGGSGKWQITGMVGKVAAVGRHVTNVAKGGTCKRCEELFKQSGFDPERMKYAVSEASLAIAQYVSGKLPHLADLGLDIGVDLEGNIKLIEINGRDQRYTFKKAKMNATFYQTYETPMQYAKFLLQNKTND
ncbi:YheC/YheD family protein [Paenibacillus sp. SYP-B3998]|uniref:YheC/YheD family protein n=1 Tax=Paenibacillus sp. SYP-B3998 TaxID=2678564 RepID=A0A6G3ZX24_9BACL|nr:YheC/YheD family protein [Paenibacillus sp. SYP-B3998]NEW06665.1 YheC/YheD family protein [Paenibacillus sp. SYP-B3998]